MASIRIVRVPRTQLVRQMQTGVPLYRQANQFYVEDDGLGFSLKKLVKNIGDAVTDAVKKVEKEVIRPVVKGDAFTSAFEHAEDVIKDVAKAAGTVAIAPSKAVLNLATGKSVLEPFQQAGKHVGDAAQTVTTLPMVEPVARFGLPAAGYVFGGPAGAAAGQAVFRSATLGREALKEENLKRTAVSAAKVGAAAAAGKWVSDKVLSAGGVGAAAKGGASAIGTGAAGAAKMAGAAQTLYSTGQMIDAALNPVQPVADIPVATPTLASNNALLPALAAGAILLLSMR